jgi:hypothetical protein
MDDPIENGENQKTWETHKQSVLLYASIFSRLSENVLRADVGSV